MLRIFQKSSENCFLRVQICKHPLDDGKEFHGSKLIDLDQLVEDMNSLQKKCPACSRLEVCMGASAQMASIYNLTLGERFHHST